MKKIIIFVFVLGLLVAVGFLYRSSGKNDAGKLSANISLDESFSLDELPAETGDSGGSDDSGSSEEPAVVSPPAGNNFTFNYPKNFIATQLPAENNVRKIVVESTEKGRGFEILIIPFDEPEPLTADRIKRDLPDIVMSDISSFPVSAGINGVTFDSTDENIGPTREVWFSARGNLYQFRTYREFGPSMEKILKTFKFNEV